MSLLFIYAKQTQNGFERDTRGYRVSTLAAAHDEYLKISKAQPHRRKQIYNEYLVRAENPYFMMSVPTEFSAREIADSLYAGGVPIESQKLMFADSKEPAFLMFEQFNN